MDKKEILKKIIQKKEFSELPKKDVETAFGKFDKEHYSDEEKIKLTRALLLKVFSFSLSKRLLTVKNKDPEWFLKKHVSTRDRFSNYNEIYKRIFKSKKTEEEKRTVFDFGAGVNGFSYEYFKRIGLNVNYVGVEAIGQLVKTVNNYFKREKISGEVFHLSLFQLEKLKKLILKYKGLKIVFLFKTIDSLELLERNYTKKFLIEISPLVDKIVVSFATRSLIKRTRFKAKRSWLINFLRENFNVLDDFEVSGERYIVFRKE